MGNEHGKHKGKDKDPKKDEKEKKKSTNLKNVEDLDEKKSEQCIIEKLKKGNRQALNMPEDELKEWARSLCVPSELREWYLNPEFAGTKEVMEKIDKLNGNINKEKKGGILSSTSEGSKDHREEDDDFKVEDIDFEVEDVEKESQQAHMKIAQSVKIKLVVAEICKSDTQKAIRKMLSPVLTKLDHQQQFGMFHSALVVGPWYLEWNNSSLCIPRKCYSSAAMLAADLEFGGIQLDLEDTIKKISKVIINWNVTKQYNQNENNCQKFVDDVCNELGLNLDKILQGPLGEYLKSLRTKGQCDLSFHINDEMREKLEIKDKVKKFTTHEELDQFVESCVEKDPQFEENFKEHMLLLKSFDRAFWLRHFKHPDDKQFIPLGGGNPTKCPFKDPTCTTSFKKEWF